MLSHQIHRFLSPAFNDRLYGSPPLKFIDFRVIEQADGVFAFYVMQVSFHVAEADALQAASFVVLQDSLQDVAVFTDDAGAFHPDVRCREQGLIIFLAKWLQKLKLLYNLFACILNGQDGVVGQLRNQICVRSGDMFSFRRFRRSSTFSVGMDRPAAMGWPPNLVNNSATFVISSNMW